MKYHYAKKNHDLTVVYGELLTPFFREMQPQTTLDLVIITNQKYYDGYQSLAMQAFQRPEKVLWYICTNDLHCNQLEEFQNFLVFLQQNNLLRNCQVTAFGNAGVCQLAAFYHEVALKKQSFPLFPVSLSALLRCLTAPAHLELAYGQPAVATDLLPEKLFYESQFTKQFSYGERQRDLFFLVRLGMVTSHTFLQELFREFPNSRALERKYFTAFIDRLLRLVENQQTAFADFGEIFQQGLQKIPTSHLISSFSKELIGFLLHVLLSQQVYGFTFHFPNFATWLMNLGFPIELPDNVLTTEIVEGILAQNGSAAFPLLTNIGETQVQQPLSAEVLMAVVTQYRQIISQIKEQKAQ